MVRIENHCVGCDIPCVNCGRKAMEVHYCDKCDDELRKVYEVDGQELCEYCLKEKFLKQ